VRIDVRSKAIVGPGVGKTGDIAFNVSRITLIADIRAPISSTGSNQKMILSCRHARIAVTEMMASYSIHNQWREPARMYNIT